MFVYPFNIHNSQKKNVFFPFFLILAKWNTKINKFYVSLKSQFHIYHKFYNTKFKFLLEAFCKKCGFLRWRKSLLIITKTVFCQRVWSVPSLRGFIPPINVQNNEIWYIYWVLWNDQVTFWFIKNREGIK